MHTQISRAVDDFQRLGSVEQANVKEILRRYVSGEIGLDEAYYDLIDKDLIPMPQRCGMHTKLQDDEEELKGYINRKLFS